MKHHYVYHSYEEWGREYIGIRRCDCLPEEDIKYFGSFRDKTFKPTEKVILFVCETREEVAEIEIKLHDFFDVSVNPQFANKAKATSTKFDTTGIPNTEEWKKAHSERMSGENHPQFGVSWTEERKKAMSGENSPMFGVPKTKKQKKKQSVAMSGKYTGEKHPNYGKTGGLSPKSKAIIAIKPGGTQLHFDSLIDTIKELRINGGVLWSILKFGKSPRRGKFEGWQFIYENR